MEKLKGKELIEEIAKAAGISRSAVYAALDPASSKIRVGKAKRELVAQLAAERGYVKNELASSLGTGRTNTIGLCIQSLRGGFFTEFFMTFDEMAYKNGYTTMFSCWEFDVQREEKILKAFIGKRVDAIAIAGYNAYGMDEALAEYSKAGGVVIFLGDAPVDGFHKIVFDERGATELQARHLWSLNHKKVAHLNASASNDERIELHCNRCKYFTAAWRKLSGKAPLCISIRSDLEISAAADAAIAAKITGIACTNDDMAIRLIAALQAKGVRVPDDISVVGLDDIESSAMFSPPLSTVRLPTGVLAKIAWQRLKEKLSSPNSPAERILIAPELVVRQSTAPLRLSNLAKLNEEAS